MTWSAALTVRRFKEAQPPQQQRETRRKAGLVGLGTKVVVVEDEAGSEEPAEEQTDRPEMSGGLQL